MKAYKWYLIEFNQRIWGNHASEDCKDCDLYITYCIVCGQHKSSDFFCYWCGDVVCYSCCPIKLECHNSEFIAINEQE